MLAICFTPTMSQSSYSHDANQKHEGFIISWILEYLRTAVIHSQLDSFDLNWTSLATALKASKESVLFWKTSILLNKQGPIDVVESVLVEWKLRCRENASLEELQKAVSNVPGWKDILAGAVQGQRHLNLPSYSWKTLTSADKGELLSKMVMCFGRKQAIHAIASKFNEQHFFTQMSKILTDTELQGLIDSPNYVLTKHTIPTRPSWYVSRGLRIHAKVNLTSLLRYTDIFLLVDTDISSLTRMLKDHRIDKSSNQIEEVSVRFIILEDPKHFDIICSITKENVHLITCQGTSFYWIQSRGQMSTILLNASGFGDAIPENSFISTHLSCHNSSVVCVTGNLGAGKRELLYNLARELYRIYPERIILCVSFVQLLKELIVLHEPIGTLSIITAMSSLVSAHATGAKFCTELLLSKKLLIELILQDYDYIVDTNKPLANKVISELVVNVSNFRIYILTRSETSIDSTLNHCTLNCVLESFDKIERQKLLETYIKQRSNVTTLEVNCIKRFSNFIYNTMETQHSQMREDIIGFPLCAVMLVDIVAKKTKLFTSEDQNTLKDVQNHISIYEVINAYLASRLPKKNSTDYIKIALKTTYPLSSIKLDLDIENMIEVDTTELLIGSGANLLFKHQIIAEFVVADYLVDELLGNTPSECQTFFQQNDLSLNFILKYILETGHDKNDIVYFTRKSFPYFVNAKLEHVNIQNDYSKSSKLKHTIIASRVISSLPIGKILSACALQDYNALFCVLVDCYTTELNQNDNNLPKLTSEDFTSAFLRICQYGSLNLIRKICEVASSEIATCTLNLQDWQVSPLHLSAKRGSFKNFIFFWKLFAIHGSNFQGLVHSTVQDTHSLLKANIVDRANIIDHLVETLGKCVLFEEFDSLPQAIAMPNIHLDLIKKLVNHGANAFATNSDMNNVAHNAALSMDPVEYHDFAAFMIRMCKRVFKCKNRSGDTPIYLAFKHITLKAETIKLLIQENEVDMSSEIGHEDTFLYHIIKRCYSVPLVSLALKFSPDWNGMVYKDKSTTLLHVAARWGNSNAIWYLLKMGAAVNAQDRKGRTALHEACIALSAKHVPAYNINAVIEQLIKYGADTDILDIYRKDPLWYIQGV